MHNAPNGLRFHRISGSLGAEIRGIPLADAGPAVPEALLRRARAALASDDGSQRELVVDAGCRIASALAEGPYRLDRFELLEPLDVAGAHLH